MLKNKESMSSIQLTIFHFKEENILVDLATVEIEGEIWFVASDVCTLLGLTNVTEALRPLDDDEKLTSDILRAGQTRKVNLVNESGLYALIFRSKKPSALKFRKWVTKEVIPSIRKTGSFHNGTPQFLATYQERILSEPTKNVQRGYWSVFDKSHKVMFLIEKHIGSINKYDLVDGSIGQRWSKFREGKHWIESGKPYIHKYTDNRGDRECKSYHRAELEYFENWMEDVYIPDHMYEYLYSKYKNEGNAFMLSKVETMIPKLLSSTS